MRVWTSHLVGFVPMMALTLGVIASFAPGAWATTLEQLTLDEMAQKSTAIVRARVTGSHAATRGADIYTYFQLQVLETWKSSGQASTEVAVPGGVVDGIRQSVSGAPELKPGQEYVLFLWTSRSGLTQLMGLSQGLFKVSEEGSGGGSGVAVVQRPAASELMLNRSGLPVDDHAVSMRLQDLRSRVRQALASAKLEASK
ncbi:MAG: hypothetical protein LAP61_06905 [Acidobacteriia bacterium]|nr:hypothetical protein [Terriglobia bacterium]